MGRRRGFSSRCRLRRRLRNSGCYGIDANFTRQVNRYIRAGGNIFRAIDPRLRRSLWADIRRLERDWRGIGAVKTFRAFLPNEHTPNRIAGMAEKKNRIMRRLWARGSLRGLGYFGGLLGRSCDLL